MFPYSQKKRTTEPIYAEPSKSSSMHGGDDGCDSSDTSKNSNSNQIHFDEYDGVELRRSPASKGGNDINRKCESVGAEVGASMSKPILKSDKDEIDPMSSSSLMTAEFATRHSDSKVLMDTGTNAQRKFHSKSYSLTENCMDGPSGRNPFRQNRELWEKRAEQQSQQFLTTSRILTRNRIAPDLVMDLPFSNKKVAVHSSHESLDSHDGGTASCSDTNSNPNDGNDSDDNAVCPNIGDANGKPGEDMTVADRFATQNQCTLKKNERYSGGNASETKPIQLDKKMTPREKPKAEVKPQEHILQNELISTESLEHFKMPTVNVNELHIDESCSSSSASTSSSESTVNLQTVTPSINDSQHKSPIPARNTQKFVSKFADLHLTGGCMISGGGTSTSETSFSSQTSQQSLSSFKPQVKVKPNISRKPLVLPPTTPESIRRHQE